MKKYLFFVLILIFSNFVVVPVQAVNITTQVPFSSDFYGGVRFRNFNNGNQQEIIIFDNPVVTSKNSTAYNFSYGTQWTNSNTFSIDYSPISGITSNVLANNPVSVSREIGEAGIVNMLQLTLSARKNGSGLFTENLVLTPLGGSSINIGNFSVQNNQYNSWYLTDVDLANGFNLSGVLNLSGSQPGGEANKFEIILGNTAHNAPVPEPTSLILFGMSAVGISLLKKTKQK